MVVFCFLLFSEENERERERGRKLKTKLLPADEVSGEIDKTIQRKDE